MRTLVVNMTLQHQINQHLMNFIDNLDHLHD